MSASNNNESVVLPGWLKTLAASLTDSDRLDRIVAVRPGLGARPAAVLILIGETDAGPDILFVERASTLRTHAGQVAFPGGAVDDDDVDLAAAAVREAIEETGVDPEGIEIIGALPAAHVSVSGFDVNPVVAWWRTPSPVGVADPREVASVHRVAVRDLTNPANRVLVQHPSGYRGPGFDVAGLLIWGLTAHFVDGVLDLAGWQQDWDKNRVASIPERYLTDRQNVSGDNAH